MKLDDALGALAARPSSAAGNASAPAADTQAWRRQMERAQADAWFHGFAGSRASEARTSAGGSTAQRGDTRPEEHSAAGPAAGGVGSKRLASPHRAVGGVSGHRSDHAVAAASQLLPAAYQAATIPFDAKPMAEPLAQAGLPPTSWPTDCARTEVTMAIAATGAGHGSPRISLTIVEPPSTVDAEPDICGSATAACGARQESTRLPVRVHVESDKHIVTVWLGLDTQTAIHLPAVTRAVSQWLAQSGYRRARWICNGQPLDLDRLTSTGIADDDQRRFAAAEPFPIIEQPQGESA